LTRKKRVRRWTKCQKNGSPPAGSTRNLHRFPLAAFSPPGIRARILLRPERPIEI